MSTQREKAELLRSLHRRGDPLVLVNVWDAVSARIIEELGFPAIATTSAGIAFLEGFGDGECIPRELMLQGVERVVRAVNVPVTADLEAGYGASVEDAADTARLAIAVGAVGMNFEDAAGHGTLLDLELQAARVAAIRETAESANIPLVINARTDAFLGGVGESDAWRLEESIRRGNRYAQAGADSVFVPGVADEELIHKLVQSIDAPVNVLAGAATPNVKRLAELGVARISVGSASIGYALAQFREAARGLKESGSFEFAAKRISHADLNALFSDRGS
jgi:2-methylisocitrate lyase-like PEP mutase family enzyme